MLFVGLSETLGAEAILGAFIAGALVSLLSPNDELERQLDSFGYGFLIPIFFVMVGVNLNLWKLFQDPKVFVLIPLLLVGLFVSKLVPTLIMKRWYKWRTVLGSGFLLTSTLSLIVAAAKIGIEVGVIDKRMSSALILLAVIASIIAPILFKKIFPFDQETSEKKQVGIVGANQLTLPITIDLDDDLFETSVYHVQREHHKDYNRSRFKVQEIDDYEIDTLKKYQLFDVDILVITTGDDERNAEIARFAKEHNMDHVIARIESADVREELKDQDVKVFSSVLSARSMLRVLIESPDVADIFTTLENGMYQVDMNNQAYDDVRLRDFPFLGDTVIVRIVRGMEAITPHGDTKMKLDDHLVVTGSKEHVDELRDALG